MWRRAMMPNEILRCAQDDREMQNGGMAQRKSRFGFLNIRTKIQDFFIYICYNIP
jgi:hypothetical protein